MGHLTEDMTRLCDEIRNLRNARKELMNDLTCGTQDRRDAVIDMQSRFRADHAEMTKRLENDRFNFIFDLKRTVNGLMQEVKSDLIGARKAWMDLNPAHRRNWRVEERKGKTAEPEFMENEEEHEEGFFPLKTRIFKGKKKKH